MKHNMGSIDRGLRALIIAPLLVLAAWALGFGTVLGIIAVVLAVVMVFTAAIGFCPLYVPFGLSTCPRTKA